MKTEGSRTICLRRLFAEKGSVAVASSVDGDRGIADAPSLSVLRRWRGPDWWRSVQKRPAGCRSGCGCNAVRMPSCNREQGNPSPPLNSPTGERGWANYSGVGHPCHQCVSKVFRRGGVHCVLTCRRTCRHPGRFRSPGDRVSVRSRRHFDGWSARSARDEAPVDAGDRSSRLHRPELRSTVSRSAFFWSSCLPTAPVDQAAESAAADSAGPRHRCGRRHSFVWVLLTDWLPVRRC